MIFQILLHYKFNLFIYRLFYVEKIHAIEDYLLSLNF